MHRFDFNRWFGIGSVALCAVYGNCGGPELNPYAETITQRNVFGLKAASAVVAEAESTPLPLPPPPKVKLTGVMTMPVGITTFQKLALLEVEFEGKTVRPILAEGASEGPVQILAIDENASSVRIVNQGMLATLRLAHTGAAAVASAAHTPLQARPLANGPAHQSVLRSRFTSEPQ